MVARGKGITAAKHHEKLHNRLRLHIFFLVSLTQDFPVHPAQRSSLAKILGRRSQI